MDKFVSEEERIRRAEEVSARRNNRIPADNINTGVKRKMSLLTKAFIQVICSICIFGIFYFINQNDSLAMEKIKPILSEDTDFAYIYNQIDLFFKNILSKENENSTSDENGNTVDSQSRENILEENNINEDGTNETIEGTDNGLEGTNENNENVNGENNGEINENTSNNESTSNEENNGETNESASNEGNVGETTENAGIGGADEVNLSQTDQDIIYIKENASFIKPVVGYITSGYGEREPTDIISANHAGVDIGANTGTEIIASMSGTVELVSDYGDYGNHIKIVNGEISTLYAHCSAIFVSPGEYIEQGQKIAEVGNTGRTTGPHLHFEIRRNNVTVDPQKILDL